MMVAARQAPLSSDNSYWQSPTTLYKTTCVRDSLNRAPQNAGALYNSDRSARPSVRPVRKKWLSPFYSTQL